MASASPPPPYSLHDVQRQKYMLTPEAHLLSRDLLHIIVLAYEVDSRALRNAFSDTKFTLSRHEQKHLLYVSKVVQRNIELASSQVMDTMSDEDCQIVYAEVMRPADELGILSFYVLRWLGYYAVHADDLKKGRKSWFWPWLRRSRLRPWEEDELLKNVGLVSECIDVISPTEEVGQLLTDANDDFAHRNCHCFDDLDGSWWKVPSRRLRRQEATRSMIMD